MFKWAKKGDINSHKKSDGIKLRGAFAEFFSSHLNVYNKLNELSASNKGLFNKNGFVKHIPDRSWRIHTPFYRAGGPKVFVSKEETETKAPEASKEKKLPSLKWVMNVYAWAGAITGALGGGALGWLGHMCSTIYHHPHVVSVAEAVELAVSFSAVTALMGAIWSAFVYYLEVYSRRISGNQGAQLASNAGLRNKKGFLSADFIRVAKEGLKTLYLGAGGIAGIFGGMKVGTSIATAIGNKLGQVGNTTQAVFITFTTVCGMVAGVAIADLLAFTVRTLQKKSAERTAREQRNF